MNKLGFSLVFGALLFLTAIFTSFIMIGDSVSGSKTISPDKNFDNNTLGELTAAEDHFNTSWDGDISDPNDKVLSLARLVKFESLPIDKVFDVSWNEDEKLAVILTSSEVWVFDGNTGLLWNDPIYDFAEATRGLIEYREDGSIWFFLQYTNTQTLENGNTIWGGKIKCFNMASVLNSAFLIEELNLEFGGNRPFILSLYDNEDYFVIGGQGINLEYHEDTGFHITDNTYLWPYKKPYKFGFDEYIFRVKINTLNYEGRGEQVKWKFYTFEGDYSSGFYTAYNIPVGPNSGWWDLLDEDDHFSFNEFYVCWQSIGACIERLDELGIDIETMYSIISRTGDPYKDVQSDVFADGITPFNVDTIDVYLDHWTVSDMDKTQSFIRAVGDYGAMWGYSENIDQFTLTRFTGSSVDPNIQNEDLNSIVTGADGSCWISSAFANKAIRSFDGWEIPMYGKGAFGMTYSEIYGYSWIVGNDVLISEVPESEIYNTYPYSQYIGPSYTNMEASKQRAGYAIMWDFSKTAFMELKNYTKDGVYTSAIMDVSNRINLLESTDSTNLEYIDGCKFQYDADIPSGTTLKAYVTNTGGNDWYPVPENGLVDFEAFKPSADAEYYKTRSIFAYKFEMTSDIFQKYSPKIDNIDYELYCLSPPNVDFNINAKLDGDLPYTNTPINFSAWDTFDSDNEGSALLFKWNFGDPFANSTNPNEIERFNEWNQTHIYTKAGQYTVRLTITDIDGHIINGTTSITIYNRLPVAVITEGDNFALLQGETLTVTGHNSYDPDGIIQQYTWNIEGNNINSKNLTYAFNNPGDHILRLIVEDDNEAISDTFAIVHVTENDTYPEARFTVTPWKSVFGTQIHFKSLSSDRIGTIKNYTWNLGDGYKAYTKDFYYSYSKPGRYTVNLTVTDDQNQTAETSMSNRPVIVNPMPEIGDWIVNGHIEVDNFEIFMQGNIIVASGGWIEFNDCEIIFGVISNGQYGIDIQQGGKITANDTEFNPYYHIDGETQIYQYNFYYWINQGELYLNNSYVRGVDTEKSAFRNGLTTLEGGKSQISFGSRIFSCEDVALSSYDRLSPDPTILDLQGSIVGLSGNAMVLDGGNVSIYDSNILNSQSGLTINNGNIISSYNTIRGNTQYGIDHSSGSLAIDNSTVLYSGDGIVFSALDITFVRNDIQASGNNTVALRSYTDLLCKDSSFAHGYYGILANGGEVTALDCIVNNNYDHYEADAGGRIYIDRFLRIQLKYRGEPVDGSIKIFEDDVLIDNGSSVGGNYGPLQLHYAIIDPANDHFPEFKVRVDIDSLFDNRSINMKYTHTEIFNFNPPIEPEGGADEGAKKKKAGVNWIAPLFSWIAIWGSIAGILYWKRDDDDFIEQYQNPMLIIGLILSVLAWFVFNPILLAGYVAYIMIGAIWVGFTIAYYVWGDTDFFSDNLYTIIAILIYVSLLIFTYFNALVWFFVLIVGLVVGVISYILLITGLLGDVEFSNPFSRDKKGESNICAWGFLVLVMIIGLFAILRILELWAFGDIAKAIFGDLFGDVGSSVTDRFGIPESGPIRDFFRG